MFQGGGGGGGGGGVIRARDGAMSSRTRGGPVGERAGAGGEKAEGRGVGSLWDALTLDAPCGRGPWMDEADGWMVRRIQHSSTRWTGRCWSG